MAPKNEVIAHANGVFFFFPNYRTWATCSTTFSLTCWFLCANNLGCAVCTWVVIGIIPFTLLYLIKPFRSVDLWAKASLDDCSYLQIMHYNICGFTKSTSKSSLTIKYHQHINKWLWGLQDTSCVSTTTSCETSTFEMLGACKCTLSTFEINENGTWSRAEVDIWSGVANNIWKKKLIECFHQLYPHSRHDNIPLQPL